MVDTLLGKAMPAGRTMILAAVTVSATLILVWCAAVIGHLRLLRSYYGLMNKAFESLDEDGREALAQDLERLLEEWNTSGDGTLVVPSDYLEVVAVRH